MGSKTGSRQLMEKAGVPVVPGMRGAGRRRARRSRRSRREAGYPILLKASAGGGGKGMRRVDAEAESAGRLRPRVASEAQASFGDGAVYAEKLVERPAARRGPGRRRRCAGTCVAVGERECSIQRRHQKVVEECPSPVVGRRPARPPLRRRRSRPRARRRLHLLRHGRVPARARRVVLLPRDEHAPAGRASRDRGGLGRGPRGGDDPRSPSASRCRSRAGALAPRGHAIECRDLRRGSRGAASRRRRARSRRCGCPQGPGVRNDVGVEAGRVVPIDYDPMLGKLIVHAPDRAAGDRAAARARWPTTRSRASRRRCRSSGRSSATPSSRAATSTCSGSTAGWPRGSFATRPGAADDVLAGGRGARGAPRRRVTPRRPDAGLALAQARRGAKALRGAELMRRLTLHPSRRRTARRRSASSSTGTPASSRAAGATETGRGRRGCRTDACRCSSRTAGRSAAGWRPGGRRRGRGRRPARGRRRSLSPSRCATASRTRRTAAQTGEDEEIRALMPGRVVEVAVAAGRPGRSRERSCSSSRR